MELTLDYNIELFPLQPGQSFALALASSLARGAPPANVDVAEEEDKERDVWRPDGKGRRGLEEDYDYVMYGKVRIFHHSGFRHFCSICFRYTSLTEERQKWCRSTPIHSRPS